MCCRRPKPLLDPPGGSRAFTVAWLAWLAAFLVIEGTALARGRPQDTLSDHVWAWFAIPRHPAPRLSVRERRVLLLSLLAWLAAHFLTGDEF